MMTDESILSKRPGLRINVILFFFFQIPSRLFVNVSSTAITFQTSISLFNLYLNAENKPSVIIELDDSFLLPCVNSR